MNRKPTISVNVHARNAVFEVETVPCEATGDFKALRVGECAILCDTPDLIRLRDVIDAALAACGEG